MDNSSILQIVLQARDEASGAIKQFSDTLSGVVEIAAGFSLANVGQELADTAKAAVDAAINFQAVTVSLGTILGNVSSGGEVAADSFGGSSSKISDIASRTADEMRNYAEKMKKYQQDIADTMVGQNVIDAQEKLQDSLAKITEQIGTASADEKDREAQRTQTMQDRLSDLKDSFATKEADKQGKYEQDMANAKGDIQKKAITKKYEDQQKLDKDAFDRQFAMEQAHLQRTKDEQDKADKEATDKKIASLQAQQAEEEKNGQQEIDRLKKENEKKLALYKQELDDEELNHKEHLARLADEAEKAGSGAAAKITQALEQNSPFKAIRRSLQDELSFIKTIEPKMPFDFNDIVALDRHMTQFGYNGQKLIPILGDIASVANVSLQTVGQAVTDAAKAGRWQMLEQDVGVTKEELKRFGAEFDKQGHLMNEGSFFEALDKMHEKGGPAFDGMNNQMGTLKGQITNLHTTLFQLSMDILGIDIASGKVTKGGAFDTITHMVMTFAEYLKTHKAEIADFFKKVLEGIINVGEFIIKYHPILIAMAGFFGILLVAAIVAAIAAFAAIVGASAPVILIIGLVGAAVALLATNWKTYWNQMGLIVKAVWDNIVNDVKTNLNNVISMINALIKGANVVTSKLPGNIKIPDIPKFESGGYVPQTGLAIVHQGEFVLSKAMLAGKQSIPSQVSNTTNNNSPVNIYATISNEMDLNLLGHKIAFAVRNSR
jgi:hypothetical protein